MTNFRGVLNNPDPLNKVLFALRDIGRTVSIFFSSHETTIYSLEKAGVRAVAKFHPQELFSSFQLIDCPGGVLAVEASCQDLLVVLQSSLHSRRSCTIQLQWQGHQLLMHFTIQKDSLVSANGAERLRTVTHSVPVYFWDAERCLAFASSLPEPYPEISFEREDLAVMKQTIDKLARLDRYVELSLRESGCLYLASRNHHVMVQVIFNIKNQAYAEDIPQHQEYSLTLDARDLQRVFSSTYVNPHKLVFGSWPCCRHLPPYSLLPILLRTFD
ncbi:hypothetical protein, variant [Fonticula alba]|uniref:Checkpoint protein n=1 Tax=Fonticula alba TaxID=691883 RepID=A0A058ZB17_FONAL|nr:hypothetical protein, variant [Fonticula alba]KCV71615.1 hypothetical protein, variant [Fonticula alba]|eukprot:XP_009493192.1 hypothetical protein, variant [Fonticula alba]